MTKENELKNKVIEWLWQQHQAQKSRPRKFAPKEITDQIGGVHTSIGHIKDDVLVELRARGLDIEYKVLGNKRYFELS